MGQPLTRLGSTTDADPVLDDLVAEMSQKLHAGQPVDIEAYARQHPDLADSLRRMLPALQSLAELGPRASSADTWRPAVPPAAAPERGMLGDYRIVREIGCGGMGVVYEAEQVSLGRRVALKVLPFAAVLDPRRLQRFTNEAHAAASLKHPNIVRIYSVGCERGVHYYAMEHIEGQTLAQVIQELRGPSAAVTANQPPSALTSVTSGLLSGARAPAVQEPHQKSADSAALRRSGEDRLKPALQTAEPVVAHTRQPEGVPAGSGFSGVPGGSRSAETASQPPAQQDAGRT